MEEEKPQPKIDYVEALYAGFFLFVLPDIIELVLMFFLGDSWFLTDIFFDPAEQLYLYLKGVKGSYVLIGNIVELIPFIGDLPIRTTTFIITVWVEHHPKIKQAAEVAYAIDAASKMPQPSKTQSPNPTPNLDGEKLNTGNSLSSNLKNQGAIPKNLNIDYNNIIENNYNPEIDMLDYAGVQQDGAPDIQKITNDKFRTTKQDGAPKIKIPDNKFGNIQQDGTPIKIPKNKNIEQNYGPEIDDENNEVNLKNA